MQSARERQFLREELWKKQRGRCYYCKRFCSLNRSRENWGYSATLEHLESREKFGPRRDERKLAMACYRCNQRMCIADQTGKMPALDTRERPKKRMGRTFLQDMDLAEKKMPKIQGIPGSFTYQLNKMRVALGRKQI